MLNFVLCDDEANMLDKISLLFEKVFIKEKWKNYAHNNVKKC